MIWLKILSCAILFFQVRSTFLDTVASEDVGCISGPSSWYFGTQSRTRSGLVCQMWSANTPHVPNYVPLDGRNHNYCRNPNDDTNGVWCYTTDPDIRKEYCDVPSCGDDSKIIWADVRNGTGAILAIQADPKKIRKQLTQTGQLDPSVIAVDDVDDHVHSEFVGIAGSYGEQTIFFADLTGNCIVVKNMDAEIESRHMFGIVDGITSLSYDWVRQNLYWSDDVMKTIMVADATLSNYVSVFSINEGSLHALALHAINEQMYFSVQQSRRATIFVSDLSGANAQPLFTNPRLYDVTSIAVDCTDNRIYFTDFFGFGSLVYSSNLNGTDVRRHFFRREKFAGISAYEDYIFITDATGRMGYDGEYYHALWLKNKKNWSSYRFAFKGDPRGMQVLSEKGEDFGSMDFHSESCFSMPLCDHICLPRKGATRKCVCAVGYTKVGDTRCQIDFKSDMFLLVADKNQRKVFQLSLNISSDVSLLQLKNLKKVTGMSVDAITGSVYVAGGGESIRKYALSGEETGIYHLPTGSKVNDAVVDPMTGNVYFSDVISQSIYVKNSYGNITRELMSSTTYASDIQKIALDLINKKVYWTNTESIEDSGQLFKMNMDGTDVEVVLSGLQWPRGLAIDYDRKSIFVSEMNQFKIYEIPLQSDDRKKNVTHQFTLTLPTAKDNFIDVKDIAVYDDVVYLLHNHKVMKGDLSTKSLSEFSTVQFYHPTSLSVYDHNRLQRHIRDFSNPCASPSECKTMCLPTSTKTSVCV